MTDHAAFCTPDTDRVVAEQHAHDDVDHISTKDHVMISSIHNNNIAGTNALATMSTAGSDGRSMNRVRSLAAPQDVMERPMSTAMSTPNQSQPLVDLRGTIGGVANILQGLLGAAGELFGAVTNGLKKILDAGTGIFGLVGNLLSQVLTRFSG
jgi:hypothetical protein